MYCEIHFFFDQLKQYPYVQENLESFNRKCQKIVQREMKRSLIIRLVDSFFDIPELDDINENEEETLEMFCKNILKMLPENGFKEKTNEYLSEKNELHHLIDFSEPLPSTPRFYSLDGLPQSGKAAALVHFMLSAVFSFQKCVLITRNIWADIPQMLNTMKKIQEDSLQKLEAMGCRNYPQLKYTTDPNYSEWSNSSSSTRIMIIMGNYSQAQKALKTLNSAENIKYNVFIDEADLVVNTAKTSIDKSFRPILDEIISQAKRVICCTATPLDVFFNNNVHVVCSNILHLPIKPNYHGLDKMKIRFLNSEQQYHCSYNKDIFEVDDCLEEYLEGFSHRTFYVEEKMPTISLIKNSLNKQHHRQVYDFCCKTYPNITLIIYDGSQTTLGGNLPNLKKIKINGKLFTKDKTNSYNLKGVLIQTVLQFLKDNGECESFPRIAIISGKLADRGLNFTSEDYGWHLTEEFYRASNSSNMSNLIQSMRIFGLSSDNIQRTLYTTEDIYNDIKKTYDVTKEIFMEAEKHQEEQITEVLSKKQIRKSEMPARKLTKNKHPLKVVTKIEISVSNYENEIRLIVEDVCTQPEIKIIHDIIEFIVEKNLTDWIQRSIILKAVTTNVTHQTTAGILTYIYKNKTITSNEDVEKGLIVKKTEGLVYFKLLS